MDWYAFVKNNFKAGNYTAANVQLFVTKGKITQDQATKIINGIEDDAA